MSIDDSSEKEFAIRKSYRGDGKKRYETVLAVNIFIFILTSNHIKKSTQLLFLLKSLFISTHETRALPTCKKSNKHFCYCILLACSLRHPSSPTARSIRSYLSRRRQRRRRTTTNRRRRFVVCRRRHRRRAKTLTNRTFSSQGKVHRLFARYVLCTNIAAQTTRTSFYFCRERALARRSLAGRFCNNHLKINSQKKTFCSFPNNQKQARGEHSQNRAIADDTPVLGLSSNNKDSTSSSSSEERERLVAEILENVDDGGARFRERE